MYSDSRKAQRNSFAHHRAELVFSNRRLQLDVGSLAAAVRKVTQRDGPLTSRALVRAGIRGFVSSRPSANGWASHRHGAGRRRHLRPHDLAHKDHSLQAAGA